MTKKKKKASIPHVVIATEQGLEAAVHRYVAVSLSQVRRKAKQQRQLARLLAEHATENRAEEEEALGLESGITLFCSTHRAELFPEGKPKSRDYGSAAVGFRLNPESLAMVLEGDKWDRVVDRLLALEWGDPFVAQKLSVDKEAFHTRKAKLSAEQLNQAGVRFEQTETFYIEPQSDLLEAARKPVEESGVAA